MEGAYPNDLFIEFMTKLQKTKPKVIVLKTDGINREEEMAYAFTLAGAKVKVVHINDLRAGKERLEDYQILALPGGFAYGDDIVSGKILAIELTSFLKDQLILIRMQLLTFLVTTL